MTTQPRELNTSEVWDRAEKLMDDEHLKDQVKRIIGPLRSVTGTRDMPPMKRVLHDIALGVAIIEARVANGETNPDPVFGPVLVTYNPVSGYDLWVRGATVYTSHLTRKKETTS